MRFRFISTAALLAATATAHAQLQTRTDYCNADPLSKRVADATALIIPKAYLQLNSAHTAYQLTTRPFNYVIGSGSAPVCPNQPYYNQIRAIQGRTGFLIGERTFMLAPHVPTSLYDPADYAVLFAWRWIEDGVQSELSPDRNCKLAIDPDNIPLTAVYHLDPTGSVYNARDSDPNNPMDYMIFQLDRPVPGVTPLPLRRSGQPLVGDPLIVPGFPHTMPLKIIGGGSIQRVGPFGIGIGDIWGGAGSSGSPAFNTRAQLVETIVARSPMAGGWGLDSTGTCLEEVFSLAADGHHYNHVTNGPIKDLPANVLPTPTTLQVSPLNAVKHVVTSTDTTNRVSSFEVSLPASAPAAVDYTVEATDLGSNSGPVQQSGIITILPASGLHTIQPGATQRFTAEISTLPANCELLDAEVRVMPKTPGAYDSVIPHRFEVVWRDFSVAPDTPWVVSTFAPPYPTRVVTISNPSAVNQTINLNTSDSWLRINGAASAQLSLPAGGSVTATLSIPSTADLDVPPGTTAHGRVTVTPGISLCTEHTRQEIDVEFTNGVAEFSASNVAEAFLPYANGASYGTAQEYSFDLSSYLGETVADVNASVSFIPPDTNPINTVPSKIKMELEIPNGPGGLPQTLVLWDGQTAPSSYLAPLPQPFSNGTRLQLDDETTPPLAGTLLSAADGTGMGGAWKIRLYNKTQSDILPLDLKLRVIRTP